MLLFWQQGYGATSLSQLLEAMGIGRSSFYAAFGDKRSLYVEALSMFAERTNAVLSDVRDQQNPAVAIRLFFEQTLFQVPERRMRRGCMLVNTVLELAQIDQGLSHLAAEKLAEMELAFEDCFRAAAMAGHMPVEQEPQHLAQFVMTVNQGLRVASRKKTSKKQLNRVLDTTLALLGMAA